MRLKSTPVKEYHGMYVKREDLCCIGGPKFSKARGVLAHIRKRQEPVIGVLDTVHSQAGWAVAAACETLGKKCIVYYPRLKADTEGTLRPSQFRAKQLGAELRPLTAGRSSILYHRARRDLPEGAYMVPNAIQIPESVTETADEVCRTEIGKYKTVVVPISSGTIATGVLMGFWKAFLERRIRRLPRFILHMGYSRSKRTVYSLLSKWITLPPDELRELVRIVDEGYAYSDKARPGPAPPFPCNAYYDLKTWVWLVENLKELRAPVLFWNIGA